MDIQQEIQVLKQRIHLCHCNIYDWNKIDKAELYNLILRALENLENRVKVIENQNGYT